MNQLLLGFVALILFVHFGGPNVPKILRDNKQLLYGIIIGLVFCSFFGNNVEGGPGHEGGGDDEGGDEGSGGDDEGELDHRRGPLAAQIDRMRQRGTIMSPTEIWNKIDPEGDMMGQDLTDPQKNSITKTCATVDQHKQCNNPPDKSCCPQKIYSNEMVSPGCLSCYQNWADAYRSTDEGSSNTH